MLSLWIVRVNGALEIWATHTYTHAPASSIRLPDYPPVGVTIAGLRPPGHPGDLASEGTMSKTMKDAPAGEPISTVLRDTIRQRRLTAYAAAKSSGVSVDAVQRFLNEERGLSLSTVDKLAAALDLTLCPGGVPGD